MIALQYCAGVSARLIKRCAAINEGIIKQPWVKQLAQCSRGTRSIVSENGQNSRDFTVTSWVVGSVDSSFIHESAPSLTLTIPLFFRRNRHRTAMKNHDRQWGCGSRSGDITLAHTSSTFQFRDLFTHLPVEWSLSKESSRTRCRTCTGSVERRTALLSFEIR